MSGDRPGQVSGQNLRRVYQSTDSSRAVENDFASRSKSSGAKHCLLLSSVRRICRHCEIPRDGHAESVLRQHPCSPQRLTQTDRKQTSELATRQYGKRTMCMVRPGASDDLNLAISLLASPFMVNNLH